MTLVRPPKRPDARAADASPQTAVKPSAMPLWGLILGAVCLLVIGVVIGVLLPIAPPQQQRPEQETRWRLSNICIAFYASQYEADSAQLAIACGEMAQQYIQAHPDTAERCLSNIWDIDAAMCIDASGQRFDTAPLDR
jgi:hypothetical protein